MVAFSSKMNPRTYPARVSTSDARKMFGALLERVGAGEVIVITRHGSPVATLKSCRDLVDGSRRQRAIEGILELRAEFLRQGPGMTLEEIRAGIAADRK